MDRLARGRIVLSSPGPARDEHALAARALLTITREQELGLSGSPSNPPNTICSDDGRYLQVPIGELLEHITHTEHGCLIKWLAHNL